MENFKEIVVTEISDIFSVYSPKGIVRKINNRKSYGMSFCSEGQITYTHNGKKYVSDNRHVIILPEGQSYTLTGDKTGTFPVINFKCNEDLTDHFLLFPIENNEEFMKNFKILERLILFPENHAKVMSIFYDMIHSLLSKNFFCQTITTAIKYVEENYKSENLTNTTLADFCNVSEVYLRKLFKKYLNTTPKQYIFEVKLKRAKYLLQEGIQKIGSISEECGFDSSYNFSRFFKEKTGLSPTEYMRQNKNLKI